MASAATICGITQAEVNDVSNHYGVDMTQGWINNQIQAPFACGEHGDLCDEVGPVLAGQLICEVWDDLVAHKSEAVLKANIDTRREVYADHWEDDYSNDGGTFAAADADSFQIASIAPVGCSVKKQVVYNATNTLKHKTRAFYNLFIIINELGGSSKGWFEDPVSGGWTKDTNGLVTLTNDWVSTGTVTTCTTTSSTSDTDGFVNQKRTAFGIAALEESTESNGGYAGLTACAYRNAPWGDPTCP